MAQIILSLNGNTQGEFELAKERMTIGRKAENDIPIDNLAISGQHALIVSIENDSFIEDLGSTNGTYINGKLIKKQALKHGDMIGIGKHELKYINEVEKNSSVNPFSYKSALVAKSSKDTETITTQVPTHAIASPDMLQGKLHILNGPIAGKKLTLSKALITLGKPGVQVAVISKRPTGYFLTHIEGNKDGQQIFPEVNGESIGTKAYTLCDGDILELAGIKMEFTLGR